MPALTADTARKLIAGLHAAEEAAGRYGYGKPICLYAQEALTTGRPAVLFPGWQNQFGLNLAQAINLGRDELGRTPEQIVTEIVERRRDRALALETIAALVCLNPEAEDLADRLKTLAYSVDAKCVAARNVTKQAA